MLNYVNKSIIRQKSIARHLKSCMFAALLLNEYFYMKVVSLVLVYLKLSFIFSILGLGNLDENTPTEIRKTEQNTANQESESKQWNQYYEEAIAEIKKHEGFANGEPYSCPAGHKTIGYGHVILKTDSFPAQITKQEADRLLRKDFNKAMRAAERLTDLTGNKKIAVAHFIFAKGVGRFMRSNLRQLVNNNKPIDNEILKWCYYTKPNGTKVKSEYSYRIRVWELDMYTRNDAPLNFVQQINYHLFLAMN